MAKPHQADTLAELISTTPKKVRSRLSRKKNTELAQAVVWDQVEGIPQSPDGKLATKYCKKSESIDLDSHLTNTDHRLLDTSDDM